jgi:hypothetical protein
LSFSQVEVMNIVEAFDLEARISPEKLPSRANGPQPLRPRGDRAFDRGGDAF